MTEGPLQPAGCRGRRPGGRRPGPPCA